MFINPHLTSNSMDANTQNELAQAWTHLNANRLDAAAGFQVWFDRENRGGV
ncbi:MAG TPA: hypothetical protein PKM57_08695 [Kiritimatiellia bacterium]|nr:hypothetical protein [Kiritimatiellia bacterium]HPS07923.1 hypothetical protein [Kiritimatiellia bacterium]